MSFGVIDEKELNDMSTVIELTKWINKGNIIPYFVWCLRDFMLDAGSYKNPNEYLDNVISTKGHDSSSDKFRIRKNISEFFRDRSCMFFVRPVNDEGKLREIEKLKVNELRPEFLSSLKDFRKLLFENLRAKRYNNKLLTGSMFISLIGDILRSFNNKEIPEIDSTMERVILQEKKVVEEHLKSLIEEYIKDNIEKSSNIIKEGIVYLIDTVVKECSSIHQEDLVCSLSMELVLFFFSKFENEKKLKYYNIGIRYEKTIESVLNSPEIMLEDLTSAIREAFSKNKFLESEVSNQFVIDKYIGKVMNKCLGILSSNESDLKNMIEELNKDLVLEQDKKKMQERIYRDQKSSIEDYQKKLSNFELLLKNKNNELTTLRNLASDSSAMTQLAIEREKNFKLEKENKELMFVR